MEETKNDTGITLEFGADDAPEAPETPVTIDEKKLQSDLEESARLTPEEKEQINAFVDKIDITNSAAVMNYGVATQRKLADFSQSTIEKVRTNDMGEVGNLLTGLVTELKGFEIEDNEKGLKAFFKKSTNKLTALKAKYSSIETNVTAVSRELEKHQVTLLKDIDILDKMYDLNLGYFKELTMYILAGKQKLEIVKNNDLKDLQAKAEVSGLPEDAQKAKDLADKCNRFEKKLYDLELSRNIALQTGPQIRLVQSADTEMAEKIQSTIVNTIPLWKNQMVIDLGVEHSNQAARAEREVNDMTNELLKKNAEKLKTAVTESAKESERGIVDIETLKHTNETLISTIDEVISIQQNGSERRHEAEKELTELEDTLKQKLMEASKK